MVYKLKVLKRFLLLVSIFIILIGLPACSADIAAISAPEADDTYIKIPDMTVSEMISAQDITVIPEPETAAIPDTTVITVIPEMPETSIQSDAAESGSPESTDKGYLTIPRFYNLYQEEAEARFHNYNLKCTVEYNHNINKQGIVYSIVFPGYYDDDNFYIPPDSIVELKVSLGKYVPDNVNINVSVSAVSDKTVYLTFDDGPTKNNTCRVLEILQKYDIKATFFLVGDFAKYYTEQVKSIYDAGHTIGCHSSTHKYSEIYSSAEAFTEDIQVWENTVYGITGELKHKLYRFPAGSAQARGDYDTYCKILQSLQDAGYTAFDWTMSNNDVWSRRRAGSLTEDEYVKASFLDQLDRLEKSSVSPKIVLLHETYDCTVNTLEWMIDTLTERGYSFGTLDMLEGNWIS